ncbi:unnamed protein product [Closterium sp. NIES-54]
MWLKCCTSSLLMPLHCCSFNRSSRSSSWRCTGAPWLMAASDRSRAFSCVMPLITDLTARSAANVQAAMLRLERDRSAAVLGSAACTSRCCRPASPPTTSRMLPSMRLPKSSLAQAAPFLGGFWKLLLLLLSATAAAERAAAATAAASIPAAAPELLLPNALLLLLLLQVVLLLRLSCCRYPRCLHAPSPRTAAAPAVRPLLRAAAAAATCCSCCSLLLLLLAAAVAPCCCCSLLLLLPTATTAATPLAAAAATATAAMTNFSVLTFDAEGRAISFDVWLDDLQLYLQSEARDGISLFVHTEGTLPPPAATAVEDHSKWLMRNATARLTVRNHLPVAERAHFSQQKTAKALYDAVVDRYSSPATIALGRLMLPYLHPELADFHTVSDLFTHLRSSEARYRAALKPAFVAANLPPQYMALYFLVTRLPDSLRTVRDQFLALDPTEITLDSLEKSLLEAEKSTVPVAASRGTPCSPFFEGCTPSPLLPQVATAAALDLLGAKEINKAIYAMYVTELSDEGACYSCEPDDASVAAAALGAIESAAALGASKSSVAGASESVASAEALHTFTLHSGASRCFFHDCTTLTPLAAPVPVSLADPTGRPVVARASTVLPCLADPSGSLSGLHLPTFSTNLVRNATL